ncbi:MAG: hypothetical protein FJ034_08930 [Chloroflexi bacterium]|nr:hypothetical protein [Chloroflexota bacterium]
MTWLPYELHPETPREGLPRPSNPLRAKGHLETVAEEVGLTLVRRDRLINTRLALSAAEFARERGTFDQVHRGMLKGHWDGTAELDSVDDLARIAGAAGLDEAELRAALAEGRYERLLDDYRADATSVGINAIPAHIVGQRYMLVGAHPYETFVEVIDRVIKEGPIEQV